MKDADIGLIRFAFAAALFAFAGRYNAGAGVLHSRVDGCAAFDRRFSEVVKLDKAAEYRWDELKTPEEVREWQEELRRRFIATIGGFPERTPLEPSVRGTVRRDGYRVEKVLFASRPGHHVTAHFFLPEDSRFSAPYPAVLVACGHSNTGKAINNYQRACVQAVKAGFAVLIYDPIDQGERAQLPGSKKFCVVGHTHVGMRAHLLGWSTAQFRIWDGIRAIDYLESRPEVDASRIGMMGQSGGGTLTAYLSALDTRIKASCPSCYICSVRTLAEDWGPQDCEQTLQGQLVHGLNHLSLGLMVWPRPLRFAFAEEDAFPFRGSMSTYASAKIFYNRFGTGAKVDFVSAPGPHSWYESTRQGSVEWMKRWLRGDSDTMTKEALAKLDDGFSFDKVDCALGESEEAKVLPGGNVMDLPGERSAYDILRDELARIDRAGRQPLTRDLVCRVAGIRTDAPLLPDEPLEYTRVTYWVKQHSSADELAAMDVWLGTSLVARKAEQMIARARASGVRRRLVASGADCIAAAHAWFVAPELFDGIELKDRPPPWRAFIEDERLEGLKLQMLIYNALRFYDWTDLLNESPPPRTASNPFEDLVPRPRSCRATAGAPTTGAASAKVVETRAAVDGAPAAVADQAYRLEIAPGEVRIVAGGDAGARYARTTLAQLSKLGGGRLPCGIVTDWPELRYRGYMVDCGRNWQPLSAIRGLLDFMAAYKLNLLHWHLTDYWGWRLASKAVPELSSDRATIRNVGCRYSQEDFVGIVDYAAKLGITVMPEFDVPGHTQAFREALGIDSMRDPRADAAIKAFLDEFVALVPLDKMPYIHLGTDEVRNEPEKVDPSVVREWAKHAAARGHAVVGWTPGIELAGDGVTYVEMQWGQKLESKGYACFDMTHRYIDVVDPFELLDMASYSKPCAWDIADGRKLGAVIGGWHDDVLGSPEEYFRNDAVLPAIVLNSDAFWRGRDADRPEFRLRMPHPSDPAFDVAEDLERRVIAQRDKVVGDCGNMPFPFLGQTSMRWRLAYADGTPIAEDVPQATIRVRAKGWQYGFCPQTNATVVAETWIRSPVEQKVGAWIGFTGFSKSSGRAIDCPTPKDGEWNRHGATVELNGVKLAPPKWTNPGLSLTEAEAKRAHFWGSCAISTKIPMTDEEYWMREPYPITLRKGWNHVKLTMPSPDPEPYAHRHAWCGTFIPMTGTSAHPREVPGLEYRATRAYANFVLDCPTGEERYPEALVSSRAVAIGK